MEDMSQVPYVSMFLCKYTIYVYMHVVYIYCFWEGSA